MIPTPQLRSDLRLLIDEQIPAGGADTDTRLTDGQLDSIITASAHIYNAASTAWERKAGMAMSERGGLAKQSAGDETTEFVDHKQYMEHCTYMAALYKSKAPRGGSRLLGFDAPSQRGVRL